MAEPYGAAAMRTSLTFNPRMGVALLGYANRTTGSLVLAGSRADRPLSVFRRLFGRVLLGPEHDLPVLRVHEDRVALIELAHQHFLRERIDDELLDRALDRARAVRRVEALLRDERLGILGELKRELPLGETRREDGRFLIDDLRQLRRDEVVED